MSKQSYSQSDSSRSSSSSSRSSFRHDLSSKNSDKINSSHPIYLCIPNEFSDEILDEVENLKKKN
jgi:hypothetical protein